MSACSSLASAACSGGLVILFFISRGETSWWFVEFFRGWHGRDKGRRGVDWHLCCCWCGSHVVGIAGGIRRMESRLFII